MKSFYERFGLKTSFDEGVEKFLNRINDRIFVYIQNKKEYALILKFVCDKLGVKFENYISSDYLGNDVFSKIESITAREFEKTLYVLEIFSGFKEEFLDVKPGIKECLANSISYDGIDLGISFHDGVFYRKGDKDLDKHIIEKTIENIGDFKAAKYYSDCLSYYLKGNKIKAIEECFKVLEKISQEILGNTKGLEANKAEILKYFGGSDSFSKEWTGIINSLYNYFCDHRHTAKDKTNENIDDLEVEATIYQTGLIINLMVNKKMLLEKK